MKILFVNPQIPTTYWSYKYILKYIGKKAAFPPLGILTVAAMVPSKHEIQVIDTNVKDVFDSDIEAADIVFFSAMIVQKQSLLQLVNRVKSFHKKVILGGPFATSSYTSYELENIDSIVIGEAEEILSELFLDLEKGKLKKLYKAQSYPQLQDTPIPRFDSIRFEDYSTMAIQFSRGCPYTCEFCDIIEMYGRKPRLKSPQQVLHEMDKLYQMGYSGSLFIVDDNFIGNKQKVKQLLQELILWQSERNFPFELFTEASMELSTDENLLELMVAAGFNMVFLGIETPVEESLQLAGKRQNVKLDLVQSIHKIQSYGLEVTGGFIVGFDSDPENIFELQKSFIAKSGVPLAMAGILTALPNTALYRRLEKENRILSIANGNNTHELKPNFQPKMDMNILVQGYKSLLKNIYQPKNYFKRCTQLIANLPNKNLSHKKLSIKEISITRIIFNIKAIYYSVSRQFFSTYGLTYFKFLLMVLIKKPVHFAYSIKLALVGHHFIKMTDDILAVDKLHKFYEIIAAKLISKKELYALNTLSKEFLLYNKKLLLKAGKSYGKFVAKYQHKAEICIDIIHKSYNKHLLLFLQKIDNMKQFQSEEKIVKAMSELKKIYHLQLPGIKSMYRKFNADYQKSFHEYFLKIENKIAETIKILELRLQNISQPALS